MLKQERFFQPHHKNFRKILSRESAEYGHKVINFLKYAEINGKTIYSQIWRLTLSDSVVHVREKNIGETPVWEQDIGETPSALMLSRRAYAHQNTKSVNFFPKLKSFLAQTTKTDPNYNVQTQTFGKTLTQIHKNYI